MNNDDKRFYLVLQLETGLIDGYYTDEQGAYESRDCWNHRYKLMNHIVLMAHDCEVNIPDNRHLPTMYYRLSSEDIRRVGMTADALIQEVIDICDEGSAYQVTSSK